MKVASLVLGAIAVLLSARPARAECWAFTITEDVLGVGHDGTIVLRLHDASAAGSDDETTYEILGPDGVSRALLAACTGCVPDQPETIRWTVTGDAAVTARFPVTDAPSVAQMGVRLAKELALEAASPSKLAVHIAGDSDERRFTAGGTLLLAKGQWYDIEQPRYSARLLDEPRSAFQFLAVTSRDSCSAGGHVEQMLRSWVMLIPRGRLDAAALVADGMRAAARKRWPLAVEKLSAAVKQDPRNLSLRRALTESLVGAGADWAAAKAALDVPIPATAHSPCVGGTELSAAHVDEASEKWPGYEAWFDAQVAGCS